jgi:AraC-like DNA-binding protein
VADGPDYQRLRDFRREMFRRIGEDWTVEKMAQAVNMSQPTFFTRYREYFRCSPIQDLLRERVQMARVQLQYSDLPIAEIASRLGYHDATHFSRQFRSMTGDCPSVYRKMNR